jgi:hypothetical protein
MTSKYQPLIDRCNELYNQPVKVDLPNLRGQLVVGRVVGWAFDEDEEDEPVLLIKFEAGRWTGGSPLEDYARLDQVEVISLAVCA